MLHRAPPAMRTLRQRGEVPGPRSHATPAGASPPPECSSFIALECRPGPNWSYTLYLGQDQIWRRELLLKTWPNESIFFSMTTLHFP